MDKQKVFDFRKRRLIMDENCHFEVPQYADAYWNDLADFIASDIPGAIKFMCEDPDCDGETFADWSSVFDVVARKTQSREFVEALKVAARRFPEACAKYSIQAFIEFAEDELLD